MDQVPHPVVGAGGLLDDPFQLGPVGKAKFSAVAKSVTFGKSPGQSFGLPGQMALKLGESGEFQVPFESSRGIHFRALPILHRSAFDLRLTFGCS